MNTLFPRYIRYFRAYIITYIDERAFKDQPRVAVSNTPITCKDLAMPATLIYIWKVIPKPITVAGPKAGICQVRERGIWPPLRLILSLLVGLGLGFPGAIN